MMTKRSAIHATFTIERVYEAEPARVFAAFASREAKGRWFVGPDDWEGSDLKLDFRVGGKESVSGGPQGGPVHTYRAQYHDIVADERIVSTYDMYLDETRISVSLATVELKAKGKGTQLVYTEQGVFLDGFDKPRERIRGMGDLLNQLGAELQRESGKAAANSRSKRK
jgi:uncharacterized protein YndB with AHSA1/START domain